MNILVATQRGQGHRGNDFCFVPEGEAVTWGMDCDREDIDGGCGCRRSLVGIVTRKATTTFTVAAMKFTANAYVDLLLASYHSAGFKTVTKARVKAVAHELLAIAAQHPVGTVLERRGSNIGVRESTVECRP